MTPEKKYLCHGIMAIVGGILLLFSFGYFYTCANMTPYLLSYARVVGQQNVESKLSIWLSALELIAQGTFMPFGGIGAQKIGFRPILGISCIVQSASILLTYFTIKAQFVWVLITYALLQGVGVGLGYSVVIKVSSSWFPKYRALIVGLTVAGYGSGALIFTPIQTAFINPNNLPVDKNNNFVDLDLLNRVPLCMLLCGGCLLGINIIGFCLIREPKTNKVDESEELQDDEENLEITSEPIEPEETNFSLKEAACTVNFYLCCLIMCFASIPVTIISSSYKLFGQEYINDDRFLSAIATTSSVFNAVGRVAWGAFADKFSFKFPLCIMLSVWAVLLITFPHLYLAGEMGMKVLFSIWVFLIWFCLSGTFVLMPFSTTALFGQKYFAINYGIVFAFFSFGSLLCGLFNTFLPDQTYVVQYSGCFVVVFAALFCAIWLGDKKMPHRLDICHTCSKQCDRYNEKRGGNV